MKTNYPLAIIATLIAAAGNAVAQDFATGAESGSSDMVGPQGIRGRETRTQQPPQTKPQTTE